MLTYKYIVKGGRGEGGVMASLSHEIKLRLASIIFLIIFYARMFFYARARKRPVLQQINRSVESFI